MSPSNIKLKQLGSSFILKTCINPKVQKKINRTSVLSKKEDKLTDGSKKKVKAQYLASKISPNSFFEKIKIKNEVKQYKTTGIDFNTKKLSPKIEVMKKITQARRGGFE